MVFCDFWLRTQQPAQAPFVPLLFRPTSTLHSMSPKKAAGALSQGDQGKAKAMPKGRKQTAAPKTATESTLVALEDISIANDSGWRAIDRARVDELKACFERGEYGQNLLRKPSILQYVGIG